MPKTKFQEVIFTIMMVFVMVYAMICYNIALNIGGMSNKVFLAAFHELVIMGPIAFVIDFFFCWSHCKEESVEDCEPGEGKSVPSGSCNLIYFSRIYVSAYESGSNHFI